jgi:hypothetical protein
MEIQPPIESPEDREVESVEREHSIVDVAFAFRQVMIELAPGVDPDDIEIALAEIDDAADTEEALGMVAGAFAQFGLDYDQGLAMVGAILQFQAVLPNGDSAREVEHFEQ